MGKVFKAITGGLLGAGSTPKAQAAPVVVQPVVDEVDTQANQAKKTRAALYATAGGAEGEELNPDQVKKRPTLLGN